MRTPPNAGPMAVPAANPAEMGANELALLRGVEMSVTDMVAAHERPATPKPVTRRQTYNSSKPDAKPMQPTPVEMAISEYTK
mmetsp:Transcript_7458/g.18286  ORF Transcript_7458/g.18286 Transcript_7458/m.18286 type:complete len:82 (-) Transcript_7458:510-755(-)